MKRSPTKGLKGPGCQQNRKWVGQLQSRSPRKLSDASSNGSINRSISPRPLKAISISNIPKVQKAKRMERIAPGKDKIAKIQDALEIDAKAIEGYQQRRNKKKAVFMPLVVQKRILRHKLNIMKRPSKMKPEKCVKPCFYFEKDQILQNNFNQLKQRIDKIEFKQQQKITRPINLPQPNQFIQMLEAYPSKDNQDLMLQGKPQISAFEELDQIVGIKQQNFFYENLKKRELNLFHFMLNPHSSQYISGWQLLRKFGFAFSSQRSDTTNKHFNDQMDRSLSTFSRILARNQYSKNVPPEFKPNPLEFAIDEALFDGKILIKLSQGWLNPRSEKQKTLKLEQQVEVSQLQQAPVVDSWLKNNLVDAKINKSGYQKADMEMYIKQELTPNEQAQLRKAKLKQEQVSYIMKVKLALAKLGIFDKKVHGKLSNSNSNIVVSTFDSISATQQGNYQPDNNLKDKSTRNKLVIMREMLKNIKELQKIVNPTSKSKRKTKETIKTKSSDQKISQKKYKK